MIIASIELVSHRQNVSVGILTLYNLMDILVLRLNFLLHSPLENDIQGVSDRLALLKDHASDRENGWDHMSCDRTQGLRSKLLEESDTFLKVTKDNLGLVCQLQ